MYKSITAKTPSSEALFYLSSLIKSSIELKRTDLRPFQ
jgi:hypothetical protein